MISDRNVIQVGEHEVGVAVDADVGQMQNFGVAPLALTAFSKSREATTCARRPSATRSGIGRVGILSP